MTISVSYSTLRNSIFLDGPDWTGPVSRCQARVRLPVLRRNNAIRHLNERDHSEGTTISTGAA